MTNKLVESNEGSVFLCLPSLLSTNIPNPIQLADTEHENSKKITAKLTQLIVAQDEHGEVDQAEQMRKSTEISKARETKQYRSRYRGRQRHICYFVFLCRYKR